jgi:D-amino peptidase
MKLYMHWDMEGASGIFRRAQAWYYKAGATEQDRVDGQRLLEADMRAAILAVLDAGVDELIVCESHHGGGNYRVAEMPQDPRVTYFEHGVADEGGRRRWMPRLDETVDGLLLPGHHAMTGTLGAFLPHSRSLDWLDFRINGESVGEIGFKACYAAHWGVPLILVQGDEAACREAEARFPGVVTAAVKRALSFDECEGLEPAAAHQLTATRIREAIEKARRRAIPVVRPALPMTVSIRLAQRTEAETAARRPGVTLLDAHTVAAQVDRYCDVMTWITGLGVE